MVRKTFTLVALVAALVLTSITPASATSDGYWDFEPMAVKGADYRPTVGDFFGDRADDILWFDTGVNRRTYWQGNVGGRGQASFTQGELPVFNLSIGNVGEESIPIVGDFAGDEHDDIFWYGVKGAADYLWTSNGDGTWVTKRFFASGDFTPLRLRNYLAGGKDDLYLLARSASAPSYYWKTADDATGAITQTQIPTYAGRRVVVGDWNGNGFEDLFFHGPGAITDIAQYTSAAGIGTTKTFTINGSYQPTVVYNVPRDGILFWGPGTAKEAYWQGISGGFKNVTIPWMDLGGTVTTFPIGAAIVTGRGVPDAMFVTGTENDFFYLASPGHEMSDQRVLVGDFDGDGWSDITWYGPGSQSDALWYLEPQSSSSATLRSGARRR